MRKIASLLTMLMLLCILAFSQTRTVTGTVRDQNGNPIPFATIAIKGTTTAVAADQNGAFSIQVAPNQRLVITAANFQGTEIAATGTTVNATLSSQAMNEVVVTALGIRRSRNTLPYAAQQISGEDVSRTRVGNAATALSGKVSGLQIIQGNALGGSTNVVIRGIKSLTSNNQALFVVDGVPIDNSNTNTANQRTGRGGYDYGNTAADINPDDIE
ncbi:MAG: TonB-dependent receptor plug domain-containing protein, partial [Flavisolibacter sp.]|nr:TonB-dependent receptor plug domain-containing protein [Flavisolibacter sp.]